MRNTENAINIRTKNVANFMVENKITVRQVAQAFNYSKSQCYVDLTVRLPKLNKRLAAKVRKVLDNNRKEGPLRGGASTAKKWAVK